MTGQVLITGAGGFVGRQISAALASRGVPFRSVLRRSAPGAPGPDVVLTDDLFAQTPDGWARMLDGIDTVVHAAWYAEPGRYLGSPLNLDCLSGTLALARAAASAGVRRFVGVGTCFEYRIEASPHAPDLALDTPLEPTSPYAAAKAAAYLALSRYLPSQDVQFAWCRLFYLYGEGEDARRFVPYLKNRLERGEIAELTTGSQVRDFLDVAMAGRQIAEVALGAVDGPVNICSGQGVTVRALAESIADSYGRRDLLRFGARPDNAVDPPRVVGVPTLGPPEGMASWSV